jgi:phage gp46-like protein
MAAEQMVVQETQALLVLEDGVQLREMLWHLGRETTAVRVVQVLAQVAAVVALAPLVVLMRVHNKVEVVEMELLIP